MREATMTKLVQTVVRSKERLGTQSKQRRGGVTDLYALDYVGEIKNLFYQNVTTTTTTGGSSSDDGDTSSIQNRVRVLTKAIKKHIPTATAEGIAGIVGNFCQESSVSAKRYEADYATSYQYDKVRSEPTAENLMGSWHRFTQLYGFALYEAGYLVGNKHWIGIGLGQWTGPRSKALFDYAKEKNKDLFSFNLQVDFMVNVDTRKAVFKTCATFSGSIEASSDKFLAEWEGVPGNATQARRTYARQYYAIVQDALKEDTSSSGGSSGGSSSSTVVGPIQQSDIKNSATFRITIPADLDRFQRWFMKFAVSSLDESDKDTDIIPLSDARLMITATNLRTGTTINLDVTGLMRKKYPCDWIGSRTSTEEIYPNNDPMEGFDMMDLAWYLNDVERDALYSAGEKIFTLSAVGNARITLRNFLKFSHIN